MFVGPSVDKYEAVQVANESLNIKKVDQVELRHLSKEELKLVPDEGKKSTPVYYIIKGTDDKRNKIVVYVSSNDKRTYFSRDY